MNTFPSRRNILGLGSAALMSAAASSLTTGCSSASATSNAIWTDNTNPAVRATTAKGAVITGTCTPAWMPVFNAFVANFNTRDEIGASVAVTHKGVPVLDAWGGYSDTLAAKPSIPWSRDTVSLVFSNTKGATALCAHTLIAQGRLDLDKPVAFYWPEFAQNGKASITVRMLMGHAAGLAAIPFSTPVATNGWADATYMAGLLAAAAPWWEPGTAYGYHAMTYGWLVGELVRRVSGVSLGTYFSTQIAKPLGMDFWIGMPDSALSQVSPMIGTTETLPVDPFNSKIASDPGSMQSAVFFNIGGWFGLPPSTPPAYNTTASLKAEIGAAGGVTNARGLATMYGALANGGALGGVRILPADYAAQVGLIRSALPIDRMLLVSTRFGLGFHGSIDNRAIGPGQSAITGLNAFGHGGFGGSFGFADPSLQVSFGYTMNRMGPGTGLNERGQSLVDTVYQVMGATSNKYGVWV